MFACSAARPSMLFPTVPVNLPTVTTVNAFALWACDYIPRSSQFQVSTSCFNSTHLLSANITTLYALFVFTFIPASITVSSLSHFFQFTPPPAYIIPYSGLPFCLSDLSHVSQGFSVSARLALF